MELKQNTQAQAALAHQRGEGRLITARTLGPGRTGLLGSSLLRTGRMRPAGEQDRQKVSTDATFFFGLPPSFRPEPEVSGSGALK